MSQRTQHVCIRNINRLIFICYENNRKDINTLCEKNAKFVNWV